MALFEEEHYGKTISKLLSTRLLIYTSMDDRKEIAESTGVGLETINRVARGKYALSENSAKAILKLAEVAFRKAGSVCEQAQSTVDDLGEYFTSKLEA